MWETADIVYWPAIKEIDLSAPDIASDELDVVSATTLSFTAAANQRYLIEISDSRGMPFDFTYTVKLTAED